MVHKRIWVALFVMTVLLGMCQVERTAGLSEGEKQFLEDINREWRTERGSGGWLGARIPRSCQALPGAAFMCSSSSDHITAIDLEGRSLSGSIPHSIGQLLALTKLNLARNQLTGTLPSSLGHLHALRQLDLSHNYLGGTIPPSLSQLSALTELSLNNNQLSGPVPCAALGQLQHLQRLQLSGNHLSGSITDSLLQLPALRLLDLHRNQLEGQLPSDWSQLPALAKLRLHRNLLSGSIPDSVGQLAALRKLDLSENQLSGPIPSSLTRLQNLTELILQKNQLSGDLPAALATQLPHLTKLYVAGNPALRGAPDEAVGLLGSLRWLYAALLCGLGAWLYWSPLLARRLSPTWLGLPPLLLASVLCSALLPQTAFLACCYLGSLLSFVASNRPQLPRRVVLVALSVAVHWLCCLWSSSGASYSLLDGLAFCFFFFLFPFFSCSLLLSSSYCLAAFFFLLFSSSDTLWWGLLSIPLSLLLSLFFDSSAAFPSLSFCFWLECCHQEESATALLVAEPLPMMSDANSTCPGVVEGASHDPRELQALRQTVVQLQAELQAKALDDARLSAEIIELRALNQHLMQTTTTQPQLFIES